MQLGGEVRSASCVPPTPWTNVYGVARSILALSTTITLVLHDSNELFSANGLSPMGIVGDIIFVNRLSLFSICPQKYLEFARWIAICILLVVASGWRPRFTGVFHWWITFSFMAYCAVPDGGDQIAAVLTLFLIPITMTDARCWHWEGPVATPRKSSLILAYSSMWIIRLQIAVVYLHAAAAKANVHEWVNGTAVYYWFVHPVHGVPEPLRSFAVAWLGNPFVVTAATWGAMLVEILLFAGLFVSKRWWPLILIAGLAFHTAISFVHGLFTFSLIMYGALVLFLRPPENEFRPSTALKKRLFSLFKKNEQFVRMPTSLGLTRHSMWRR